MKEKNREEVPVESKEQVERIKEILPHCTEREIYEALKDGKMDSNDAAQRLLSQDSSVETEKNREAVPMEGKEKVERIKKMVPRFAEELICEVLKQCNMDSNLAIRRLLAQETGKHRERSPMEWKEQFECIKEMVPRFTKEDREGVPMEWKEQVELIKEMMSCFTEETIYKMLEQCYIDSDLTLPRLLSPETPSNSGSLLNTFSSPLSSAKSSVASQLHSVSLDKGKEVVRHTEDDAATMSRSNVRALCAKGPWSSHVVQAGSNPMSLGHNVASSSRNDSAYNEALGSFEILEYKLFPPPTRQYGISFTPSDLVANTDQPSELRRLLRFPFLDNSSVPSKSSAAGSQHPQTSTSEWRQRKQRGCTNGGEGESVKFCKTAVNCERMVPRFADELIYKVLEQCNMDSNLAIQRLLSQETRKNSERSFMELTKQVERIKEMVPPFAEVDGEGVPMEWKQQVECVKEKLPCFTEEMICKMHEQCNIDSEPETPSNSGSLSSSAKSSVASQLQSVSLDRAKEVACCTEDDAAPTSRSNVRASRAKGPRSSHASQAGSDPVAIGHKASLGGSDFLEYKLFPPPTQQYGKSFMLNDLVANANQPSELRRLLRSPFLDTPSEPSRSSAAGSQHPQTSTSESGPTEATPTSPTRPFRDPQDPVLDAPFGVSRYGPIQRPKRMSESGRSEATTSNFSKCSIQSTRRNSTGLASSRFHHADAHSVSNAQPVTESASIHRSLETLSLGNNMSACCGFTRPYIVPSFYQPLWPLQQHGYMDGGDNMHWNFGYDMPSAQQEVHQAGSLSRANADASAWGSYPGAGSAPPGSLTISPAPSDISRSVHDFALHAQAQHQLRTDYRPAEVNYSYAAWNHQPDSGAMSALPELQLGSFPGWAPLPPRANNQRAEGCSQRYAYWGYPSGQLPETSVMPKHE